MKLFVEDTEDRTDKEVVKATKVHVTNYLFLYHAICKNLGCIFETLSSFLQRQMILNIQLSTGSFKA